MTESIQELPPEVHSRLVRLLDEPDAAFAREVDALCAAQPALAAAIRTEAAGLLRAGRAGTASGAGVLPPTGPEPLPTRIGPFRVVAEVGQGGMVTVYLAESSDPKQRGHQARYRHEGGAGLSSLKAKVGATGAKALAERRASVTALEAKANNRQTCGSGTSRRGSCTTR